MCLGLPDIIFEHTWIFPADPVFDDYDLLRERAFMEQKQSVVANGGAGTVEMT
jgi:hypothetical protein